ncbi:MAG: energy transducer TonB [Cyclobacteriaceae bacterium]
MRRLAAVFTLVLFVFASNAQNDATTPMVKNLKEVAASIDYPELAKSQVQEGKVILEVTICPKGNVKDVVVKEATNAEFQKAVELAAQQLKFVPSIKADGGTVESKMEIPFEFKLEISSSSLVMN